MIDPLSQTTDIIKTLKQELSQCRELWTAIDRDNPHFDPQTDLHWQKKLATSWIYGTTDMLESNELINWRLEPIPSSAIASMKAKECIKYWREYLRFKEAYYKSSKKFKFNTPNPGETLVNFLTRMASQIAQHGWGEPIEERAFRSFLGYVRRFQDGAFVEHIFPKKMEIHHGLIIRNIDSERYPIPEELACQILMAFADKALEGRKDARLTALECLALCWICLAAARLKLPTFFEALLATKVSSLNPNAHSPTIALPNLFGPKEVPISKKIAQFLFSLASISTKTPTEIFFRRPRKTLTRSLEEVIESIAPNPKYGHITYVSFMTLPHHFDNHRYQRK